MGIIIYLYSSFFFNDTATTEIYTLSLHDALPISGGGASIDIKSDYDEVKHHERGFLGIFDFETGSLPFVRYTIQMPAASRLQIHDYKSGINVSNLKADLKLHTYKGTVRVAGLDG